MTYEVQTWGRSIGTTRPTGISEGWLHYDTGNGRYEFHDGSAWVEWAYTVPDGIGDLSGVTITGTPDEKDLLAYETASLAWVNYKLNPYAVLTGNSTEGANKEVVISENGILVRGPGDLTEVVCSASQLLGRLATGGIDFQDMADVAAEILAASAHHPRYQGRAATQTWDGTTRYLALNTDDKKETGYTHSTSTTNSEVTVDFDGEIDLSYKVSFNFTNVGVGRAWIEVDTGGGFAAITGTQTHGVCSTAGGRQHASLIPFSRTVSNGDKFRVAFARYGAGSGATVTNESVFKIFKVRSG
jgi:hypothetical protein